MMRTTAAIRCGSVAASVVALIVAIPGPAGAKAIPTEPGGLFAGYQVARPTTHVSSAAATFTVPTITCRKNLSGVGPAVLVNSTVNTKKNSFTFSGGGVGAGCENKVAVYQAILVVNGTNYDDSEVPVSAGDTVTISVSMTPAKTIVTLIDLTSKSGKTRTGKGKTGASVRIGGSALEINKHLVGLDPFTRISVTNAKVNGKSLSSQRPVRLTWTRGKTTLVVAGALSAGKDFPVTFKNSN
jgi:hypothetical protein